MRQIRVSVAVLAVASTFLTLLIYWMNWIHYPWSRYAIFPETSINVQYSKTGAVVLEPDTRIMVIETRQRYRAKKENAKLYQAESIIDTPGCNIPKLPVNFTRTSQTTKHPRTCGKRAVFLKRLHERGKIQVTIKSRVMKSYLRKTASFRCCYQYVANAQANLTRSNTCERIRNSDTIILEHDIIKVKCFEMGKKNVNPIYEDFYAFTKYNVQVTKLNPEFTKKYNVLMLGMDSMSFARVTQTMPETYAFIKENSWLSFTGYHKVGDNTLPNLMATLTGKDLPTLESQCFKNIDKCKDIFIWDRFKKSGYATAYGEDYIQLPDTFSKDYKFKNTPPTDHFLRPLFEQGEKEMGNKTIVCTGKIPSGQHILDYARDFITTYRAHNFFGLFWINSYSHNVQRTDPQDADKMILKFLNQLSYSGVLENTFVIFFSDHGIRFGDHRLNMEAYYDDRLPMYFMWVPISFKKKQTLEYRNTIENQLKLVTPYDLHKTLLQIHQISVRERKLNWDYSDVCPKCRSLFDSISPHRSCKDVKINDKWCACHKMFPLDMQDLDAQRALDFLVQQIATKLLNIQTKRCWECMNRTLNKFLRVHYYHEGFDNTLFFVLAFTMNPGDTAYEATVIIGSGADITLLEPINAISPYRGLGKCAMNGRDRLFCMCQKVNDCQN